ncbi:MAG: D-aminoacyl-tRNA deacylase [Promethearchaeota archaeon]
MNIRDKFLNNRVFNFTETKHIWHNHPTFKLESDNSEELNILLGLTKEPLIFLNDLKLKSSDIDPDFLIFVSRHTSKTSRPAFLVHTTGNWSTTADYGGEARDLSLTSALLHKAGFMSFLQRDLPTKLAKFLIDIEVTHHGPTILEKPLIFMELGSSKTEWVIQEAGGFIASVIINTIFKYLEFRKVSTQKIGLGFGGTHYAPNFKRLISEKNIALSFICPKYYIQDLDYDLITKMVNNTSEKIDYFIVDWKGTKSEDRKHLIPLLEEFDIAIKKTKEI